MKKIMMSVSALGLMAVSASALAATGAEIVDERGCLECHEFAYDFEGVDATEMEALITARLEVPKHKATTGLTPEDVKALAEYIAAEANK
jgi:mono/diheme cytochrome c family protein